MARNNYLELPVADIARAKAFYARAFGEVFTDFGPSYAATMTGNSDIGLQADPVEKSAAPLVVMRRRPRRDAGRGDGGRRRGHGADLQLPRRAPLPLSRPGRARTGGDAAGGVNGRYRSRSRGISSTKLQGRWRASSWSRRMPSHASRTAPVEPGSANR